MIDVIALDTETALIEPGNLAPPLTCIQIHDGKHTLLMHVKDTDPADVALLLKSSTITGKNIAYDMAVLMTEWPELIPLIFEAYENDRIRDCGLAKKIVDNSEGLPIDKGDYSLGAIAESLLGVQLDKEGPTRTSYGPLRDVPLSQWPKAAIEYAEKDAIITWDVDRAIHDVCENLLADEYRQARGAWFLHLISLHGIMTSKERILKFKTATEALYSDCVSHCKGAGLVRPDGTRDTKKAKLKMLEVCEKEDLPVHRTKGFFELQELADNHAPLSDRQRKNLADPLFGVSLDEEACLESGDETLKRYSQVSSLMTVVETHIPALLNGADGVPIQPRFNSFLKTGRTSCYGYSEKAPTNGYQLQNVRRLPGIRECFVPREGTLFINADVSGLELATWAQVCIWLFGRSRLAEVINSGQDPHLMLAAKIEGVPYADILTRYQAGDKRAKEARTFSKIGNFGFQGGMGAKSFRAYAAKSYGKKMSQEQCETLREGWFETWPESREYFDWVSAQLDPHTGEARIRSLRSDRFRGGCSFSAAANLGFQGLGADATKDMGFYIAKECYVDCGTDLYGCRPVNYVHDEFIAEAPIEYAAAAAYRLSEVMEERGKIWLPDVPPKAEPLVMPYWSKDAGPTFNEHGDLIPWSPNQ